jgi:hypothetical protein
METPTPPLIQDDSVHITTHDLNADTLKAIDRTLRPTHEEMLGMIQHLLIQKKWSRSLLAAIIGITDTDLTLYMRDVHKPPIVVLRLIWMLYTLNTAPELAMDMIQLVSWGKGRRAIRKPVITTPERRAEIIEQIKGWDKTHPRRLSIIGASREFMVNVSAAKTLLLKAGYRPANGRKSTYRKKTGSKLLRPDSMWLRVNWSQPDAVIVEQTGCTKLTVAKNRYTFRRMSPLALKRHLMAIGVNPAGFEKIFRNSLYKQFPRKPKIKNNIFPVAPEQEPDTITGHGEDSKAPEPVLVQGNQAERELSGHDTGAQENQAR